MKEFLFVVIVFMANVIEGITGFAGTMLAMPASIGLIGMQEAKSVLNLVAILASLRIAVSNRQNIQIKQTITVILWMSLGMGIGVSLFDHLAVEILLPCYGGLIAAVSFHGLFVKHNVKLPKIGLIFVVILAGVIHGMFLSGGALLVIYGVNVLKDKAIIRATLAPVWIALNLILLLQELIAGTINNRIVFLFSICIFPTLLALYLGEFLHKKLSQELFIRVTYILLLLSGVSLVV